MPLSAGTRLGPYEVAALLGAGGMGEVYRAWDSRLGRAVALKVVATEAKPSPDRLRRFEREARAVAALNHPNVLAVHDVGNEDGNPYVVFELLEGQPLRARLDRGPVPVAKAVEWAGQICHGLAAAHARGIIHRDLKPDNVFVTSDGQVKILDFGLARLTALDPAEIEDVQTHTATAPGGVWGTPGYMSPEQASGGATSARSDIFALGVILYEMLSGRRPFAGETRESILRALLNEDPPAIGVRGTRVAIPASLERVVRRCLEKNPDDRFQSARDVGFALEAVAGREGGAATEPPVTGSRGRRWAATAAIVLVTAAATALAVAWASRRLNDRRPPTFTQLTFRRGTVGAARFTADGSSVVYSALWEGGPSEVFLRRLDSPESVSLNLPPASLESVSVRGELAIRLVPPGEFGVSSWVGTLARVPLSGGAVRPLLDGVLMADWSPDGRDLAIVRWLDGQFQLEYPIGTVLLRPCRAQSMIRVSPGGDWVAMADPHAGFTLVNRSGIHKTLDVDGDSYGIAWSPRGDSLLVAGEDAGSRRFVRRVTVTGGVTDLYAIPGDFYLHDRAADGRILLHHGLGRFGDLAKPPGGAEERELAVSAWSYVVGLSADGSQALMHDVQQFPGSVILRPTGGAPFLRLGEGIPGGLSADGRWVLVGEGTILSLRRLTLTPTGTGEPVPVPIGRLEPGFEGASGSGPVWHVGKDGVGFSGAEPGRPRRSFFVTLPAGEPKAVTPEGTLAIPGRMPGGNILGYSTDGTLSLYPLAGGEARPVSARLAPDPFVLPLRVSGDGRFVFVREGVIPARIARIEISTGRKTPWRSLRPKETAGKTQILSLSLTPDGEGYAYTYGEYLLNLFLVEGLP